MSFVSLPNRHVPLSFLPWMRKLGLHNQTDLVLYALKRGVIMMPEA